MGCGCKERREALKRAARKAWDKVNQKLGKNRPYPKRILPDPSFKP